ncbi:hypothetical protein MLD38_021280 [Melastoma candidum]|uniref:Uncharacterized protein n=1 Tax=Melastoma candidum TaxID=119954 RepID=A0ACB9QGL0_9MYRT|nr:hypothetical protein MLD38_021280 [Melastoma candidum]
MAPPRPVDATTTFLWQVGMATVLKLLLLPSYHSTDLEVHRNWLAITRSLPLSDWYSPSSPGSNPSPWTLDYPPFFAYFQLLLSSAAFAVDPFITHLHLGIDYKSSSVIFFQRCSVILADSLLFAGAYLVSRRMSGPARWTLWMLILWSPRLIIVDHMHFQYNGFLLGWIHRFMGLCHAYWAPNVWVFYILLDKLLSFVLRRLGFEISLPAASFTGGLVGDSSPFAVLPQGQSFPY